MPASKPSPAVLARLRSIESIASATRLDAASRLADFDRQLDRAFDISFVAALLTGGPVDPCPNLTYDGTRRAGLLKWEGGIPSLLFEEYDLEVRKRFTIAHELGHFYLHPREAETPKYCPPNHEDSGETVPGDVVLDHEYEVDAFAAAFLMPAEQLLADIKRFGKSVPFLAERYEVSEPAMRRRLETLEWLKEAEHEDSAPI